MEGAAGERRGGGGRRLNDEEEDFPYFETRGFGSDFVRLESPLCQRVPGGEIERDSEGRAVLECMCGNVLSGRFDPSLPFFTANGSFWTNSTTHLLATTTEADRQAHTRNRCNTAGYESMALIPLRHGGRTIGLLQLNSRAKDMLTLEMVTFLEQLGDQIAVTVAQRQTEEALRKSMDKYQRIVETAHEGIWSIDSQLKTTFVNRHMAEMLGYSPEEMAGQLFTDFMFPEDREAYRRGAERTGTEATITTAEVRFRRRDGAAVWVLISATATRDDDGKHVGALGMFMDITQRKQVEADRQKLEELLHQAQKMEAVGLLAGGVAHDFNNHLTVILGYSNLLLARFPQGSPDRIMVADIKEAGERAASLTRQLLAFSRKQILAPKVLDLNQAVTTIEKMFRRLIGEDIILTTVYSPNLCPVRVDPGQLEQVVLNLAVNARDAMPAGGRFTIETGDWSADEEFCRQHTGCRPGRYVLLSLTDTGTGMGPEVKTKIFEPFFTTKEQGKGTGLGLATVFGIVKQSEGMIDVYSELGIGTCFKIYLPAVEALDAAGQPDAERARAQGGSETVLLVEDEEGVRRIARLALEAHGYSVLEASSGAEALALVAEQRGPIHLLVTDIVMPGMSGRKLAEAFLVSSPGTRVLFMSGYTDDTVVRHGIVEASAAYLHKPFSPDELARKALEVLDDTQ
jgi:PAS domain S-box-containing protein